MAIYVNSLYIKERLFEFYKNYVLPFFKAIIYFCYV